MRNLLPGLLCLSLMPGLLVAVPLQPERSRYSGPPRALLRIEVPKGLDPATFRHSQATILKKGKVIFVVVRDRKAREVKLLSRQADPAGWLRVNLRVKVFKDGTVAVSLPKGKPRDQVVLVNLVVDVFRKEVNGHSRRRIQAELQGLSSVAEVYRAELQRAKILMRKISKEQGQATSRQQAKELAKSLESFQKEGERARKGLRKTQAQTKKLRAMAGNPVVTLLRRATLPK